MPNDSNGNFREGFNLPGDLRDIAQQELGETPAVKEQALHQLRELILGGFKRIGRRIFEYICYRTLFLHLRSLIAFLAQIMHVGELYQ